MGYMEETEAEDMIRSCTLGDAHDEALLRALDASLQAVGAERLEYTYDVRDDSETLKWKFRVGSDTLRAAATTSGGLHVTGPPELISRIVNGVAARSAKHRRLEPTTQPRPARRRRRTPAKGSKPKGFGR